MAKINNVGLNLSQKIANPFKTSRSMSTPNPFKYSNFEGNTLPFADVLEEFEQKNNSKIKMISASVAGSMNKLNSLLPESIVNFVNRVREGFSSVMNKNLFTIPGEQAVRDIMNSDILELGKGASDTISKGVSSAISYANKDLFYIPGEKTIRNIMNSDMKDLGKIVSDSISNLGKRNSAQSMDATNFGKELHSKWSNLISKVHQNRISKDTPVAELRTMWLDENALSNKEVA